MSFEAPGTLCYADPGRFNCDFTAVGLAIKHVEELVNETERFRVNALVRLGGVTRIVVGQTTIPA
jgi:hypothetical protein